MNEKHYVDFFNVYNNDGINYFIFKKKIYH